MVQVSLIIQNTTLTSCGAAGCIAGNPAARPGSRNIPTLEKKRTHPRNHGTTTTLTLHSIPTLTVLTPSGPPPLLVSAKCLLGPIQRQAVQQASCQAKLAPLFLLTLLLLSHSLARSLSATFSFRTHHSLLYSRVKQAVLTRSKLCGVSREWQCLLPHFKLAAPVAGRAGPAINHSTIALFIRAR